MVMKQGGIGQSHELIIGSTRSEQAMSANSRERAAKAEPGETDYLTVVSGGPREQVRVNPP
jgi:hypothetical protein